MDEFRDMAGEHALDEHGDHVDVVQADEVPGAGFAAFDTATVDGHSILANEKRGPVPHGVLSREFGVIADTRPLLPLPRRPRGRRVHRPSVAIDGGIVPAHAIEANPNHPLADLTPAQRLDAMYLALGTLILTGMQPEKAHRE